MDILKFTIAFILVWDVIYASFMLTSFVFLSKPNGLKEDFKAFFVYLASVGSMAYVLIQIFKG
jgi:tryptophan-rich sensory protein